MGNCIVVDLDGTLSDCSHRLHHVEGMTPDWDNFFAGIAADPPNKWCVKLCDLYWKKGYGIHLVSGRPNRYREVTEQWLHNNKISYSSLYMRADGDRRSDDIVKREILHESLPITEIELVIDDRESVVKMWREEGLTCLQCNPH